MSENMYRRRRRRRRRSPILTLLLFIVILTAAVFACVAISEAVKENLKMRWRL